MAANYKYDDQLAEILTFRLHPQLLPFVGEKYEKYRILQIGESHYLSQKSNAEKFGIQYVNEHWWVDECNDLVDEYGEDFNTRGIVDGAYMSGKLRDRAFSIYTNFIKVFSEVVLDEKIEHITDEKKKLYKYMAYMNFFQMPSLYSGMAYSDALFASEKKSCSYGLAEKLQQICIDESSDTVDKVIDILKPRAVVFTSSAAWEAFNGRKHPDRKGIAIIKTVHPGCSYWNRPIKEFHGKSGQEHLEEELSRIYNR